MADLSRNVADLPTVIIGANTSGVATTPVGSDANGNLYTNDTIESAILSGSITVSTSSVAARVGTSNLSNRKMLMISPVTNIVYLGSSSAVTTATGIPIYPGQVMSFAFSANVTPYLISGSSGTVNIFEGA